MSNTDRCLYTQPHHPHQWGGTTSLWCPGVPGLAPDFTASVVPLVKPKSHRVRNTLIGVFVVPPVLVVAAIVIGYAVSAGTTEPLEYSKPVPGSGDQTITPTPDKPRVTPPVPKKVGIEGDGTWMVGAEVKPGTYRSTRGSDELCYWARLSSTDGEFESIITNGNGTGQTVTIKATDVAFETARCGGWVKVR